MNAIIEPTRILIVEDDQILGKTMSVGLSDKGYDCTLTTEAAEAAKLAGEKAHQIIVLDLALEDESGLGLLRCVRELDPNVSIILLTPLEFRSERIMGIEAGADDFVIKPFTLRELLARVEVTKARSKARPKSTITVGPLVMDLTARRIHRGDQLIPLTPTEFRILELLMRNRRRVVTRRMLCEFLWSPDWEGVTNVIEVHINRLRSKLEQDGRSELIHTVRGSGYCLEWRENGSEQLQPQTTGMVS